MRRTGFKEKDASKRLDRIVLIALLAKRSMFILVCWADVGSVVENLDKRIIAMPQQNEWRGQGSASCSFENVWLNPR